LEYQILGKPFADNALFVRIQSGQAVHRLLFDCGESVLYPLANAEIQSIDHLFFSHCHMDHIAGFDTFCRMNYNREDKPVCIWGPQDIQRVIYHRLQGFTWNLVGGQPGAWKVNQIGANAIESTLYLATDAFITPNPQPAQPWKNMILSHNDFSVQAILLNHGIESAGYAVLEPTRWNIDTTALQEHQIAPGPWLKMLKDFSQDPGTSIAIGTTTYSLGWLREKLLKSTPGESLVYLTDFILDDETQKKLITWIPQNSVIICESQYSNKDLELAQKNFHLTNTQAAHLALQSNAQKLFLIHISQRYGILDMENILKEARSIFPSTFYSPEWRIAQ